MVAHRVTAGAALALALMGIAGPAVYRGAADVLIERRIGALVGAGGRLTVGQVRSRLESGAVELRDVALAGPGWRVSIGSLRLPSPPLGPPALASSAWARSATVSIENMAVTLGKAEVRVPHLEMRGTDLDAPALTKLVDPADPATPEDRLAIFTAASLTAPEVWIGDAGADLATGDRLALHDVILTDVVQGRIGALAVGRTDMRITAATDAAAAAPIEVGRVEVAALDLPLALRIATASRVEAMPNLLPVFRSLGLHGLVIHGDDGVTVKLGDVVSGALRARPLLLSPADIEMLAGKTDFDRTLAEKQALADTVVDGLQSVVLDHLEMGGAEVAARPGNPTSFHLRHVAMDGVEPMKLGALALDDAGLGAEGVDVSLGHFTVEGYDASSLLGALKQVVLGVRNPKFVPDLNQAMLAKTSIALSDLRIVLPESSGGMGPLRHGKNAIEIPVASLKGHADAGTFQTEAFVQVRYDVGADPKFRELAAMGIGRMDVSADYAIGYNPAAQQLTVGRIALDGVDLGRVAVSARLGGVRPDLVQGGQTPDAAAKAAESIVFQGFTLDLANAGLVEKILPSLAAKANVSVPLFKAQMKTQAELSLTQALGPGPTTDKLLAAVRTFIDAPRTFALSVAAPAGLKITRISAAADPKALLKELTIDAVADR